MKLAGDRNRDRADQHDGVAVELAVDRVFIDAANAAAVTVVDAVIDAQRLRDDEVAADHVDMRTLQRRVVEAHRQPGGDIELQQTGGLLDQLERMGVGHAGVFVVDRLIVVLRQIGVDLRPCAVNHHQANAQTMQQPDIVDDVGEILVFDGFPTEHDDKRLAAVGIDIGD